jgi:hypothetical protein
VTRQIPVSDTLPWYRQFWPWFLILLPASMVVASLYTAYIASRGADDLVVADYYQDGLTINRQLEKQQRAQVLGISATLRFNGDEVQVTMAAPVADAELLLSLAHPLEADRDFLVTLEKVGPAFYRGTLTHGIAPHWHWTLEPRPTADWRLDGTVQPGDIGDVPRG